MKKLILILLLLLVFPLSCLAKPVIKCDRQTFDPITLTYCLEGNVSVDTGKRLITANKAKVELYSLEVYAEGEITLTQDNIVFTGDAVHVTGSDKTAVVTGNVNFAENGVNIKADRGSFNWGTKDALFEGKVRIKAEDVHFTENTSELLKSGKDENGGVTTERIIYNVRSKKFHD